MDTREYLRSYGWTDGTPLQAGGLAKPILVKHKKDNKGIGHAINQGEMWWENLFDGQLKGLEVTSNKGGEINFEQNKKITDYEIRKRVSPLYTWFVKGEGLKGSFEEERKINKSSDKDGALVISKKEKKEKKKERNDEKARKKLEKKEKKKKEKKEEKRLQKQKKKLEKKEKKKSEKKSEKESKKRKYDDEDKESKKKRKCKDKSSSKKQNL